MISEMEVFGRILERRGEQDIKWGPLPRNLPTRTWLAVLVEEVGEVAKADLEHDFDNYVYELIDVAAVVTAMLQEAIYAGKL
jgi:NTP pyrophosphatase (non-canonical NTP hydrolase)